MNNLKLFMLLLGGRPKGRLTEQHDIFFGIGRELKDLIPHIKLFWPEVKNSFHIDAWREVTRVNNYTIQINEKSLNKTSQPKLFFLNLGGYKKEQFDEFHYKFLTVADTLGEATQKAKQTSFYNDFGFKGATSHIDEKYAIDVDDVFSVEDILQDFFKERYSLQITESKNHKEDKMHLGYLPTRKI